MIYLDHGATTPVYKEVQQSLAVWGENFFNPSSTNSQSYKVKDEVERCRKVIADTLEVLPSEIFFTSGGTEGDNWVLNSWHDTTSDDHLLITDNIEHAAVLNTCRYLASVRGRDAVYLSVDKNGYIPMNMLELAQKGDLIAVIGANNEIGTIQNLAEIGRIAQETGAYFFSDCVQLYPHMKIHPKRLGIDALSVSAHKFGGLKGTGFVYVSKRMQNDDKLIPFMHGGGQESGFRAGTENTLGIMAMTKAIQITQENMARNEEICAKLKDRLLTGIQNEISDIKVNSNADGLASCLNVCFLGCDNQQLMALLDTADIIVSAGSACHSGASEPSHVLRAIGLSTIEANSAIRFTLGAENTEAEIDYTIQMLKQSVEALRDM